MTELAPTIALGVGSALLAFEGFAALRSLAEVGSFMDRGGGRPRARVTREPLSFTTRSEFRAHFVAQRHVVNGLRRQYPALRSSGHGRQLRVAIRRVHRHPLIGELQATVPPDGGAPSLRDERRFELRLSLARVYSLMTPTNHRITRTMTITPTIPTPPLL